MFFSSRNEYFVFFYLMFAFIVYLKSCDSPSLVTNLVNNFVNYQIKGTKRLRESTNSVIKLVKNSVDRQIR